MSFYYLSQELADVLELSTEKKYHIDYICVEFQHLVEQKKTNYGIICVDDNFKKLIHKDNVSLYLDNYHIARIQMEKNYHTLKNILLTPNPNRPESSTKSVEKDIYTLECFLNNKTDAEIEENRYKYYYLNYGNKRWLEESEHLIPEWKKETEKLQKKISILEEENRQLKENFKTNVVDIIKEYIYNFLPSFLK